MGDDSICEILMTCAEVIVLILAVFIVIWLLVYIIGKIIKACRRNALIKIARAKGDERDKAIQQIVLPNLTIPPTLLEEVLNSDVTSLIKMLESGKVTSEQLVTIFLQRSLSIGLDHKLITEVNFEEALSLAKECDRLRATKSNKKHQLLFGIPISIKDLFEMKGFESNYGCGSLCNQPKEKDGYIIRLLRSHGAIPFIRSNIPQAGFALECWNAVYGRGLNPWNKNRTPGGSSGGEAALIAARCSPLGLGSDMGGSIRVPAGFCGVYGFKPSSLRIPGKGAVVMTKAFDGLTNVVPVSFGPLAKSCEDIAVFMRCLLDEKFHEENRGKEDGDPFFVGRAWNEAAYCEKKKYKIGFLSNCDHMPVCGSAVRAMEESVEALKNCGHSVVEVEITFLAEVQSIFYQAVTADRNFGAFQEAMGEQGPDDEIFKNLAGLLALPLWVKNLVIKLAGCVGMPRLAGLVQSVKSKQTHEFLELIHSIKALREKFVKWWNLYGLDALLLPNTGMPAFKHGFSQDISVYGVFGMLSNLIDLPAGAVPITLVYENEKVYDERIRSNRDMITSKTRENLEDSQGMPVGIQVVTMFMQEEKCVGIMKQIEEKVGFHKKYGYAV